MYLLHYSKKRQQISRLWFTRVGRSTVYTRRKWQAEAKFTLDSKEVGKGTVYIRVKMLGRGTVYTKVKKVGGGRV